MTSSETQEISEPSGAPSTDSPSNARFPLFSRLGGAVVQVAASAGEILVDRDLRRKAGNLVVSEAGKRIKDIQEGVATRAGNLQHGLNQGPRQVQSLYARIQKQYLASRHESSLKARRDTPVDVQVGPFLWEDAPQELRSRLWIALLGNPNLIGNLIQERHLETSLLRSDESSWKARASPNIPGTPATGGSTPTAAATADRSKSTELPAPSERSASGESAQGRPAGQEGEAQEASAPEAADANPGPSHEAQQVDLRASSLSVSPAEPQKERAYGGDESAGDESSGQEDAWEIVQDASSLSDFRGSQLPVARLQPGQRGAAMTFRERLLEAICEVTWPISTVYPEGCQYDTLCQISIGQEEVEEVIQRDINRTFPEHPQFSFEQGQQELFRVLKAYSLHDLQVGYCQGMAFVTGVILMYVPEEPAFRLLTRLMDESGANLRLLYLPGLEGLKNYLRMFEWLMDQSLPHLRAHLEEHGVVPVLYASQWFLTAFSCPFPTSFSCRVIDVMLTECSGHIMLRVGLAVIRACEPALMQLFDFEDLVTHLKVEPVKWTQQKARSVLNEAIEGAVAEDTLRAAAEAVSDGYDGSLSRRPSSVQKPSSASDLKEASLESTGSSTAAAAAPASELKPETSGVPAVAQEGTGVDDEELRLALDALWVGKETEDSAEE